MRATVFSENKPLVWIFCYIKILTLLWAVYKDWAHLPTFTCICTSICLSSHQFCSFIYPSFYCVCVCVCVCSAASVMSDSLQPTGLLCWDFPGKNTGVDCRSLLLGIFLIQGSHWHLLCLLHCRWILYPWATEEAPSILLLMNIQRNMSQNFMHLMLTASLCGLRVFVFVLALSLHCF